MARVLITDAGGRGAALVDAYAKSLNVSEIFVVPGNDLMQINTQKKIHLFPNLKTTSKREILKICQDEKIDLIDVAHDNAIEAGVSDLLRENGFKVFGPTRLAGQLEWDKAYAREFMVKYNLPIPKFWVFKDPNTAKEFLKTQNEQPFVIKASGLAEGKGVIIAQNIAQASDAVDEMSKFGSSGKTFLIEEYLVGEEFSSYAISDGKSFQYIASAQDHKRVFEKDLGPNTGGMGCSTPPLVVNENIKNQILNIFEKTFEGLGKEGRPYLGILYLGGIVVGGKVYVIEFNARWGDPELECILPGVENDWYEVALATIEGRLDEVKVEHDGKSRVVVAGASKGYPGDYSEVKGKQIYGLDKVMALDGIRIYSAGVKKIDSKYQAFGGRLFYIVGEGKDVIEAREKAYGAMNMVSIEGENLHFRKDIGYRDVERLAQP